MAERIIAKLRGAEVALAEGQMVRRLGVTEQTYDR